MKTPTANHAVRMVKHTTNYANVSRSVFLEPNHHTGVYSWKHRTNGKDMWGRFEGPTTKPRGW